MKENNTQGESTNAGSQLLVGEQITFEDADSKPQATDEELNRRYVKGDIRIVTETARYSLAGILSMLQETVATDDQTGREPRYKLDPEYQRRHRWGQKRKSRLIESFLMNVPVPPVFLYERDLARFEVMDGRQRLNTLSEFYADEFDLQGLQFWTELHGRTYSQLPSKVRDGIDRRYISSIILLKETATDQAQAAQLKKMVFERLNSGGVRLSPQETRNAVYDGPLNQLCLRLSKNQDFRTMWGIPSESPAETEEYDEDDDDFEVDRQDDVRVTKLGQRMFEKMEDVELVLRFFAYRQIDSFPGGLNRISAFLDRFLIEGNKFAPKIITEYKEIFETTISFVANTIGNCAFCRPNREGELAGRPTKIVYDPVMYVASKYSSGGTGKRLLAGKAVLVDELASMHRKNDRLFAGRSTNVADTRERNRLVEKVFQNALNKLKT